MNLNIVPFFKTASKQITMLNKKHGPAMNIDHQWLRKLEDAQKSLEYDKSGFTSMYLFSKLYKDFIYDKGYLNIGYAVNNPEKLIDFLRSASGIEKTIIASGVEDVLSDLLKALGKHFKESELTDKSTIADIYVKSLNGLSNFAKYEFTTGQDSVEPQQLNLYSHIYLWRDYNSMLSHTYQLPDGIYMCFIETVFGFLIKNGDNLFAVMDNSQGSSEKRFRPYSHIETEPNFYMPYSFLKEWEKLKGSEITLFDRSRLEQMGDFVHQYAPEILCTIEELPFNSQVYLVVMYELFISRYTELKSSLKTVKTGSNVIFGGLLPSPVIQQFITVDEVMSDRYLKRFPNTKFTGRNKVLEDLFAKNVDWRILNLVKHNDKLYVPDENGSYVHFVNDFKYEKPRGVSVKHEPNYQAFDLTYVASQEELETLRYQVARNNYAEALSCFKDDYMSCETPKIRNFIYDHVMQNIERITPLFGYENITVPFTLNDGETRYELLESKISYTNESNYRFKSNQRIRFADRKGNSCVERCFISGAKKYAEIKISFQTPDEICRFTGVPYQDLHEALRFYQKNDFSQRYLTDSVDKLNPLWDNLEIELFFIISKTVVNKSFKQRNTQLLDGLDIEVTEWQ
jgi:hypothetical protein